MRYGIIIKQLNEMTNYYEKQYSALDVINNKYGIAEMGLMSSFTWNSDPKRLLFVLSRYKAVSKFLANYQDVLEVGCGDAFGSRIVAQNTGNLDVTDIDKKLLANAEQINRNSPFPINTFWHDFLEGPTTKKYNGIYLLDVLEHIDPNCEDNFVGNIVNSLLVNGTLIIGIPSLESQKYASYESKRGHINCKSQDGLKSFLGNFFNSVYMMSMNDEVLHTGYGPMSHYLFALCTSIK